MCAISSSVEYDLPKVERWVRFPYGAFSYALMRGHAPRRAQIMVSRPGIVCFRCLDTHKKSRFIPYKPLAGRCFCAEGDIALRVCSAGP